MLELQNVNKFYTTNGVTNLGLRNINLKFNLGEVVAITGDSGSGKSTLLNVIAKIDSFDEGEIYYKGNETSYFSLKDMDDFRKNKIGFIFQNYNIIDSYTVLENVMVPLFLKGYSKKNAKEKAISLIEKVGLKGKEKNRGSKLSGGEKQRCVIARALASDCEILICDEPTGNLDSRTTKEIVSLIQEVSKDKLVLIVTHNFEDFKDIVTRKTTMQDGEVLEDVIYQQIPKDEDVNLDLDYVPLMKKIKLKIAKNNIIYTPRKSLFTLIVFLCINFFTLFLFQSIAATNDALLYINSYNNKQSNRVYIYNKNQEVLDVKKIQALCDKTIINSYYEDFELQISDDDTILLDGYYNQYNESYKKVKGTLPKKINEIYIIFPTSYLAENSDSKVSKCIGKKVNIGRSSYELIDSPKYLITGYGKSDELSECIIFGTLETEKQIKRRMTDFSIACQLITPWQNTKYDLSITETNEQLNNSFQIRVPANFSLKNWQVEIILNGIYNITDYEVVMDDTLTEPIAYYSPDVFETNSVFEMSAYTKRPNSLKRNIEKLGYCCDIVKTYNQTDGLSTFILNMTKYFSMIISSFNLWIIFFITYFILSKVYTSKKKDYQILRTLGVTKKDMGQIVTTEVLMMGITAWFISLILFTIIFRNSGLLTYTSGLGLGTIIIFLITSLLFAYLTARRFNRKLFRFSVVRSLKEEE